jgi:DNA-binding MarR family transcriptional regulator
MAPTTNANEVADRLHSAAIHLLRGVAREDPKSGLSAARLSALSVVVFAGPLSLTELAAAERVRPPTMTRIVQALERDGLVRRRASPHDRRSVEIHATAKGRRRLATARQRRVRKLAEALEALTPADREALARAAERMEAVSERL